MFISYFKNSVRLAILVSGIAIGALGTLVLLRGYIVMPAVLMVAGFVYVIGIRAMLMRYIGLVGEGLTLKEKVSR